MANTIKLKIFRYDPLLDSEPSYSDYEVPFDDNGKSEPMSLTQALFYVNEEIEPIAYDLNCGAGLCGRCAIMINGSPYLACWTKVEAEKEYVLEPLEGFPVIKDLVVDKSSTYEKYVNTDVSVQARIPMTDLVSIDYNLYWNTFEKLNLCRECMCCYAACPVMREGVANRFIGPGAMMQIAMRHFDPNDEADRAWQAAFSGVFECDLCGKCAAVCPVGIDLIGLLDALQKAAKSEGLGAGVTVFDDSIVNASLAIAEAQKASASTGQTVSATSTVDEIIQTSCGVNSCHDTQRVIDYRADFDTASLRVNSHVATQVELTDEQKQGFIEYFTRK